MSQADDPKYLANLPQLGLTADQVPADMRAALYSKLGLTPPKKDLAEQIIESAGTDKEKQAEKRKKKKAKAKQRVDEAQKVAQLKETDLLTGNTELGGNEKITMSDLFFSIDKDKLQEKGQEDPTVNTNKLRKQIKSLKKDTEKAPAATAPKSGRKRKLQEMQANYDINQKNLGKFINQVKKAREEVQSDFTTADKLLHGGKVVLNSVA